MKIDRSVALFALPALGLLATISACQVIVDGPPKHPAPPPPPSPAAQATPAAPAAPGAEPREVKVVPMHLHGPGAAPAGGGTAPPAGACLDVGAATVGDCGAMQAGASCPTATPTPQQRCNAFKTYFAPKVAAAAVSCLTALTSAQVCDPTQVSACGRAALAQACPAPTVAQLCQIAASPCKTSAGDCTAILSGLDGQGQQAVAQCVAQGCSAGLSACIDSLASTSSAVSAAH